MGKINIAEKISGLHKKTSQSIILLRKRQFTREDKMKGIFAALVISVFLFGAAFAGISDVKQESKIKIENVIEKVYDFEMPEIAMDGKYAIVSLKGAKSIMQEGMPTLPYKVDVLRFPVGTKISVKIEDIKAKEIKLPAKIKPYPMYTLLTIQGKLEIKESSVYKSNKAYPEKWVEPRITVGLYNGERVVTLSLFLYPCRYVPSENKLLYTEKIDVFIEYMPPEKPLLTKDEYDLLIICPNKYKYGIKWYEELLPLVEHKEKYGIKTKLVSLDQVMGGVYFPVRGRDDAEKLKYFIKDAIEQWGIKYVMLVGGRQGGVFKERWLMPVRYTHLDDQSNWETGYLSDLYFADIYKYEDGQPVFEDWDSNDDGIFAEWSGFKKDILDLNPDVYIGRLACRNVMEVKIMVNKIIEYESNNATNQDWFKRMVVVGGDTFPPYPDDPYYEGEVANAKALEYMEGFEGVKLWTSLGTLNGPEDIINAVSQGCGFLDFEGHGNPMSWATHPPHDEETWIGIDVTQFYKFSNKGMYPVCMIGGCHNSQFNVSLFNLARIRKIYETYWKSEWSPECYGWWIVRKSDGGAIASIGCTGLGYGYIGDYDNDSIPDTLQGLGGWIDTEFFRVYGQEGKEILGEIHSTAIANYVANFPVMKNPIDCKTVQEWVLLGDPSLKLGGYS